jgi:hypothetical protein
MQEPTESSTASGWNPPASNRGRGTSADSDKPGRKRTEPSSDHPVDRPVTRFLNVVIDADTAQVVRIEGQDVTGARHELSPDEKTSFAKRAADERLEHLVEEAFEAGIACVLDGDGIPDPANESAEDAELRHQLLAPLIERSSVKRWMERGALNRVIVNTLIDHATT